MTRRTTRAVGASVALGLTLTTMALTRAPEAFAAGPGTAATTSSTGFLEPFYTEGDLTGDRQVTQADVALLTGALGTSAGQPGWPAVSAADLDGNKTIDIADVASLSRREVYDDGSFALVEASAVDMQKAMNAGVVTSVQLTQQYLARIAAYDKTVVDTSTTGRALNAIITTGGESLAAARESDALRASNGGPRSMLDGIPVLLKDNYDTRDMPTSAGCACWETNQTTDDAFMVDGMRADGAVVMGKASLDEFAYGFSSTFSAGSPFNATAVTNGVKYVASPYNTAQTAGGSSGGTGAAISANLGGIGFGSDTGGSIRNPSSYNQLVGVRPTVGLASRDGIVPLALSQDTGGPIGRSVEDVAIALDAVVGSDPKDAVTAGADAKVPASYTQYLDPDALRGKSFAYFTTMVPPATATNPAQVAGRRIFMDAVVDLQAQGATVTAIDPATLTADPTTKVTLAAILGEGSGSTNEFKHDLDLYIAQHLGSAVGVRSLAQLVTSGKFVPAYKSVYSSRDAITAEAYTTWIGTHGSLIRNGKAYLTGLMDSRDLDAIIYPTALPYTTFNQNLRLSPNTGMPAVTVPAGRTSATETLPGAGVNLELLGRDFAEGELLGDAFAFEQATTERTSPVLYPAIAGDTRTGPGTDADKAGDGSTRITGPTTPVRAGSTFTVQVDQSAADLYAYQLPVSFDASKLAVVSVTSGTTGTTSYVVKGGLLTITHTKRGTSPGAQGTTGLATITFRALADGSSSIAAGGVSDVDSTGRLTTTFAPVPLGVTTLPAPPAPATRAATAVTAKLRPGTVGQGSKVTLRVAVAATTGTPTGTVVVRVGKVKLSGTTTLVDGRARITFEAERRPGGPRVRTRDVTVVFKPTGSFLGSSTTTTLRIKR